MRVVHLWKCTLKRSHRSRLCSLQIFFISSFLRIQKRTRNPCIIYAPISVPNSNLVLSNFNPKLHNSSSHKFYCSFSQRTWRKIQRFQRIFWALKSCYSCLRHQKEIAKKKNHNIGASTTLLTSHAFCETRTGNLACCLCVIVKLLR